MTGETYKRITSYIRQKKALNNLIVYGNKILTNIIYVSFFSMLIYMLFKRDIFLVKIVLVTGISFVIISIFRKLYNAPRPYTLYDFKPLINKEKKGDSFPSRHVFSVFIIAMSYLCINRVLAAAVFIIGILIAITRVAAGVHFIKDVAAGAIMGILCGIAGFFII